MTRRRTWCLISAVAALLGGCASPEPLAADAGRLTSTPAHASVELTGHGLVLQKEAELPVLCLGPFAASRPPKCGGPTIWNWDWAEAGDYESASGVNGERMR
jgi:hypothetical protein